MGTLRAALAALLLPALHAAAETVEFPVMGLTTPLAEPVPIRAEFDPGWFDGDPFAYSHGIARLACILSDVSYVDATAEGNALSLCYDALGIPDGDREIDYDLDYSGGDNDKAAHSFALLRAEGGPVVIVVVRGTPLSAHEWISNLNIADSSRQEEQFHEGFRRATERIVPRLRAFLKRKGIAPESARILVTGHSRGAAIANLLSAELSALDGFRSAKIFAYTFATPNVTTAEAAGDGRFGYIWNIESEEDLIPCVPPERGEWRFRKFGRILMLPSRWKFPADEYERKKSRMDEVFRTLMLRDYEPFRIGAFVPIQMTRLLTRLNSTVDSYYGFFGIRKFDWIFWRIFPEDGGDEPEDGGAPGKTTLRFADMHVCETYLSWLLALGEDELFGTAGSVELRIAGAAECAVLSADGTPLAVVRDGYADYGSVRSPVGALSYPGRTFVGLPTTEPFRIRIQKESLIPSPVRVTTTRYDERGILVGRIDARTLWLHAGEGVELASDGSIEPTERGPLPLLRRGWRPYIAPEIAFAPGRELSFGLNAGTRHVHAVALVAPPIVRDRTRLSLGLGTELNPWWRLYANVAALCALSWEDGERTAFPAARISLSVRAAHSAEIFAACRLDWEDAPKSAAPEPSFSFGLRL